MRNYKTVKVLTNNYKVMSRTLVEIKSNTVCVTDFGDGDDFSVEQTFRKNRDGSITVVSSKIIGKAKDFTDTEIDKYKKSKTK